MDKNDHKDDRKSQLNHIKHKLSSASKGKLSKPASAREKKSKNNSNKFIEELKEKYENQTILEGSQTNRMIQSDRNAETNDNDFLSVVSNLENFLSSVGNRQDMKKGLK